MQWDQRRYPCPHPTGPALSTSTQSSWATRACQAALGHLSPQLWGGCAGSSPPRAFARLDLEADGFHVSFPRVTACLAPCRGLLIPLSLLSPPSPGRGWPRCSCRATSRQLMPPLLLGPAPQGNALRPQQAVVRLQGSPKAMASPTDVAVAPEAAGNGSAPNYPEGLPWRVGGWSSYFICYQKH